MHAAGVKINAVDRDIVVFEDLFYLIHHLCIDLDSRPYAADLNGRRFPEKVRQGVNDAEQNGGQR